VRQIGQRHQQRRPVLFDLIHLYFQLTDLLAACSVRREDGRGVEALALRARDFVTCGILFPLQTLQLRNEPAAPGFQRRNLLEFRVRFEAAISIASTHIFQPVAKHSWVEHYLNPIPSRCRMKYDAVNGDPQSRLSRSRSRNALSPRDKGAAEGNVAARRQADHSVRR
jgi:hypothetical protein